MSTEAVPPLSPAPSGNQAELTPAASELLRRTWLHLNAGELHLAEAVLGGAELVAPAHVAVQHARGVLLKHAGRFSDARIIFKRLLRLQPESVSLLNDFAESALDGGDIDVGIAVLRKVCELRPDDPFGWFNLGRALMDHAWTEDSLPALSRAVDLDPSNVHARTLCADVMVLLGLTVPAREQYLEVLRRAPWTGSAWWGLANIKTVKLSDEEIARLEIMSRVPGVAEHNKLAMGCVLGKAYEDHGRYPEAFKVLVETNARISERRPWDTAKFSALVDMNLREFDRPHQCANDPRLGEEVIFIVSLPRSGSTLTEQILAAHPDVEGASELGDVSKVLQDESERLGLDFPLWITHASAEDWARLGRTYLEKTSRWRRRRPRSTDKMPNNWYFVGALRAMLPGAHIVNCRRDPVETCWSCFKQMFSVSNEFSYDLGHLARFWHDYDRTMRHWQPLAPARIRDQIYEELLAKPETEVRELLDFCGLSFDQACLRFHDVKRSVRTASAAQVREPLRRDTARSGAYGVLLDPLRAALAAPAVNP